MPNAAAIANRDMDAPSLRGQTRRLQTRGSARCGRSSRVSETRTPRWMEDGGQLARRQRERLRMGRMRDGRERREPDARRPRHACDLRVRARVARRTSRRAFAIAVIARALVVAVLRRASDAVHDVDGEVCDARDLQAEARAKDPCRAQHDGREVAEARSRPPIRQTAGGLLAARHRRCVSPGPRSPSTASRRGRTKSYPRRSLRTGASRRSAAQWVSSLDRLAAHRAHVGGQLIADHRDRTPATPTCR